MCVRVHWCVCVYAINILILVGEAARLPEVCTGLEANKCAPCDKDNDNEGKNREQGVGGAKKNAQGWARGMYTACVAV